MYKGIKLIRSSIQGGGALVVAGFGVVGAGAIVVGTSAGLIQVAIGGKILTASAGNFGKDVSRFKELREALRLNIRWEKMEQKQLVK